MFPWTQSLPRHLSTAWWRLLSGSSLASTLMCTGHLTDEVPPNVSPQRFLRSTDPSFYVHAQRIQKRLRRNLGTTVNDWIPLEDYLFRYDRGAFWTTGYAVRYFSTPFNRITRFILDPSYARASCIALYIRVAFRISIWSRTLAFRMTRSKN
jgi:hypothetical protein